MALFVLGDTHLSLGGSKPMDVFPGWNGYVERLEANWRKLVKPEDTIVLAGDISWAMRLTDTRRDTRQRDAVTKSWGECPAGDNAFMLVALRIGKTYRQFITQHAFFGHHQTNQFFCAMLTLHFQGFTTDEVTICRFPGDSPAHVGG